MNPNILEVTRQWTMAMPTVSAFVTSLVRHFQDRDDILQETAVAVIESYEKYDRTQPFLPWAIGIARIKTLQYWRRQQRQQIQFDSQTIEALATAFTEEMPVDPRLDDLKSCLEMLAPRAKEICHNRYAKEMKPAAIATDMKLAPNTVAKALQRIRLQLKECIEMRLGGASRG